MLMDNITPLLGLTYNGHNFCLLVLKLPFTFQIAMIHNFGCRVPNQCRFCNKVFSSVGNVKKHEQAQHIKVYKLYCQLCGKGFMDNWQLRAHLAKHANVKMFQCHLCSCQYAYKKDLARHLATVHGATGKGTSSFLKN